ncbi:CoA pyrophosphatase [Pseudoalteromonas sp. S2755]|uniref:CoA pyrophosphatase n=1 Tax=Pseudoalteromonas sp. S2755 TaxID=2066523 RepID=UPI00110B4C7F|nr:CoA pyrophosphatase [Pseudoalteromonas sp. S2755]TMN35340.1 CoA pyrophosphatase [Pseudoalteromonas sp. S2755]
MKIDQVISQFMLAPIMAQTPTTLHTLKQSAVLIPIVDVNARAHLLFCKRSSKLPSHPSQICFPGGKVEQQDSNIINTALRETEEEIGLAISESQVLGILPFMQTLTGYQITPVVASVQQDATWVNHSDEVQHTFTVPLNQLSAAKNWRTFHFTNNGKPVSLDGFMTPHGLLWGATAKIVKQFTALF